MENEKPDFRSALTVVKLLTTSIFARRRPYMVTTVDHKGRFYYTNIDENRVEVYHPDPEDVLSVVTLENQEILDTFYKAFPKLLEMSVIFNVPKLSTALNKYLKLHSGDSKKGTLWFPPLVVTEGSKDVIIEVPYSETDKLTKEKVEYPVTIVGQIVSDDLYKLYDRIMENHKAFSNDVVRMEYQIKDTDSDTKLTFQEITPNGPGTEGFKMPMVDGFSIGPSKEYLKKRDLPPLFSLEVLRDDINKTAKVLMDYTDDWFRSTTILPGSLWFLSRLRQFTDAF